MNERAEQQKQGVNRRGFLYGLGLSAGAAAMGLAPAAQAAPPTDGPPAKGQPAGYRETEHVKQAYDSFRF